MIYIAELLAFIILNNEKFSMLRKALQEHPDAKSETEVGELFHGEEIKRRQNPSIEMKLGSVQNCV